MNYKWLNEVSNNVTKQAIKDACDSYKRFFKDYQNILNLKVKRNQN
jgi:putative transposase